MAKAKEDTGFDVNTDEDQAFDTFSDGSEDSLMVNLSEVEAMSFDVFPKGNYPLVIDDMEFQISKSSGKPMWAMRFSVTEGEFANRKLFSYWSFSEKALPMTKTNIAAVAPELLEGPFNPKQVADEAMLVGRTCMGKVGIEKGTDGNEDRNVVKSVKSMSEADSGDGFSI